MIKYTDFYPGDHETGQYFSIRTDGIQRPKNV